MEFKSCFILMPFTKAGNLEKDDLDYVYTHIIKKAVDGFQVSGKKYFHRVERFESNVGSIVSGIVENLNTAELVIADLTGLNPNVMYELGVRHSLKRGTIIISQNLNNLPSDLRDYLTVGYVYSTNTIEQSKNFEKFQIEMGKTINEVISTSKYDSPVLSYLKQKQVFRQDEEVAKLKKNAIILNSIIFECQEIATLIRDLKKMKFAVSNISIYQVFNHKLNFIHTALNELDISYDSGKLYRQITNSKAILYDISKIFSLSEYFDSLKKIDGIPEGTFGPSDVRGYVERKFLNIFSIEDSRRLELITIEELFKSKGVLDKELIFDLVRYIEVTAKSLGVNKKVLKEVIG